MSIESTAAPCAKKTVTKLVTPFTYTLYTFCVGATTTIQVKHRPRVLVGHTGHVRLNAVCAQCAPTAALTLALTVRSNAAPVRHAAC